MEPTINPELQQLVRADQQDHHEPAAYATPEYWAVRQRDQARRERVRAILAAGQLQQPEDYYHAALILQHHGDLSEVWQAYQLARQAAGLGYRPARWLTAAAYDRWLMYQGRPQKYGTQIVPDGQQYRVWDVEPATTDAERAAWDVRPLAQQQARAAAMTRTEPLPPMERAPAWLKQALSRWSGGA